MYLIFFVTLNIYCFYSAMLTDVGDTSTIMHISRPEGFWENSEPLPIYSRADFIENTSSTLPGLVELEGDVSYRNYWNGLYMDQQNIPHNIPEYSKVEDSIVVEEGNYGDRGYNKKIKHHYGGSSNIHRTESHYYSKHKNPYVIQPGRSTPKTSWITSIKNKVIKWGKGLDKGTEEYIKSRKRWSNKAEQAHQARKRVKAYEKLYGKSAMDRITRAETISSFTDPFRKKSRTKYKKTLY